MHELVERFTFADHTQFPPRALLYGFQSLLEITDLSGEDIIAFGKCLIVGRLA